MRHRVFSTVVGVLTAGASLAACSTSSTAPGESSSATPEQIHAVTVLASPENCDAQPLIVDAGTITFTATSNSDLSISVSLYAPQDGAFLNRIARIRVLKPNETKTMSADLAQGAYEIACGTEELTSRKRITAI